MAIAIADAAKQVTDRDLLSIVHQVRRGRAAPPAIGVHGRRHRGSLKRRVETASLQQRVENGEMTMSSIRKTIAVLPGDGIGPEVTRAAIQLLQRLRRRFRPQFRISRTALRRRRHRRAAARRLPAETLAACRKADAILLGAIGGPKWDALPLGERPESGLLAPAEGTRALHQSSSDPFAPLPARNFAAAPGTRRGCDFEIVRELAGDIYFGAHEHPIAKRPLRAPATSPHYRSAEIERVARYAFERAAARKRRLASVDKANVLATSALWRETVTGVARRISRQSRSSTIRGQRRDADRASPRRNSTSSSPRIFSAIF